MLGRVSDFLCKKVMGKKTRGASRAIASFSEFGQGSLVENTCKFYRVSRIRFRHKSSTKIS